MLPIKTKIHSGESYLKANDSHVNTLISFCVWTTYWYTYLECVCAVWLRRVCHKRETWMNWLCLFCYRECCSAGLSVTVNMSDNACFSTLDLQWQKDSRTNPLKMLPFSINKTTIFITTDAVVWRYTFRCGLENRIRRATWSLSPQRQVGFLFRFFNKCRACINRL